VLRGKPGFAKFEIDAAGRPVRALEGPENRQEPVAGQDVQLTLDLRIQQYAEQILDAELRKRRLERPPLPLKPGTNEPDTSQPLKPLFPAGSGSLVVLDTTNAEVMAMASNPPYDNRWFTAPLSKAKFQQLFGFGNNPNTPLINRVISGQYQIGSTMKIFTAIAGMRNGTLNPTDQPEVENSRGRYIIPNCDVGEPSGCERRNSGGFRYGSPTLQEALTVSSDAYFYDQGAKLYERGKEVAAPLFQNELRSFGFGGASGIDLPDENTGYVPDAALKKRFAERGVISEREGAGYYIGDNINLAIGQGLLSVTPLQLANAYATFANGGTLRSPRIAYGVREPGGPTLKGQPNVLNVIDTPPVQTLGPVLKNPEAPPVDLPASLREPILDGLRGVTQDSFVCSLNAPCRPGTGVDTFRGFDWKAFPVWGKTGTAQDVTQRDEKDDSLFAAFGGPGDVPRYAVTAVLEDSGFGSAAAALTVRCMYEKLASNAFADVKPSDPLNRNQTRAAILPRLSEEDQACLRVIDDQIYNSMFGVRSAGQNE
jgi:penicillin-binding protein 2